MSTQNPADGSLQSTKQMLDELDALMEKMLSLPVNDAEDAPAFPNEIVPERALTATLTLLQTPAPAPQPAVSLPQEVQPHPAVNPPHRSMAGPVTTFEPAPLVAPPVYTPAPVTNDVVPASLLPQMDILLASIAEERPAASPPGYYLPLLWVNQAFDACTAILGPAGAHLRSRGARLVMGYTGIAPVLGSVGWLCKDWLGWK